MKKIFLLHLLVLLFSQLKAQDTTAILAKIKIIPAEEKQIQTVKQAVLQALETGDDSGLFGGFVIIGPALWKRYQTKEELKDIPEGNVDFKIPVFDQNGKQTGMGSTQGKLVQSPGDFKKLWAAVAAELKGKNPVVLGSASFTRRDLFYHWLLFANKLEEPVFIIESNGKRFLFKSVQSTFLFIVEDMTP